MGFLPRKAFQDIASAQDGIDEISILQVVLFHFIITAVALLLRIKVFVNKNLHEPDIVFCILGCC